MVERGADRRGRDRDDRGAAAVEFALVVLPLLYLVYGIIGYGFLLSFRQAMSQATAEGARAVAVAPPGTDNATLQKLAREEINRSLSSYSVACAETGKLMHGIDDEGEGGDEAGECTVSTPEECGESTQDEATFMCVTVALDYDYGLEPMIPAFGTDIVMPNTLTYTSSVRVS